MSNIARMMQRATAGAAGAGLDVDEVFSTFLYDGNSSTQTITNNIDLSGEGGLVWIKSRSDNSSHCLYDTNRGVTSQLNTNYNSAVTTTSSNTSQDFTTFNSNGFGLGAPQNTGNINSNSNNYVSWTFRKAPKFFDVVTYTGNGNSSHAINHNLGSTPGMILVKRTNGSGDWNVAHRSLTASNYYIILNSDSGQVNGSNVWTSAPTGTTFTVGDDNAVNSNGDTFIAYLFAHNNNDGEFGPDGDADIIKCGSYTGNGSSTGPVIDLGFEPQWLMIKSSSNSRDWLIFDNMRGITTGGNDPFLIANGSAAEEDNPRIRLTSTGFQPDEVSSDTNNNGYTYIYMAIRRGPLAAPDDATKVFYVKKGTADYTAPFVTDLCIMTTTSSAQNYVFTRLTNPDAELRTNATNAEVSASIGTNVFADNTGVDLSHPNWYGSTSNTVGWLWKRAPSYFDVVAYTGNNTSGRTISHNLGAAPEMMWVKRRDGVKEWAVYHKNLTSSSYYLILNDTDAESQNFNPFNYTAPSSSVITLGNWGATNNNGETYVAYLFATVAGVSKVGSYTGTGAGNNQNIDCGFSSGARFVLIKRTNTTGSWYVFDSVRGINASAVDPYLQLNSTAAEASNFSIEPLSSGFTIVQDGPTELNISGSTYIFYAVA